MSPCQPDRCNFIYTLEAEGTEGWSGDSDGGGDACTFLELILVAELAGQSMPQTEQSLITYIFHISNTLTFPATGNTATAFRLDKYLRRNKKVSHFH
jgi:hypothetical protein